MMAPLDVCNHFQITGTPVSAVPYGSGTINDTYCVVCQPYRRYILQRINRTVFPDVPRLMANMHAVLSFVQRRLAMQGQDPLQNSLVLISPKAGNNYIIDDDGDYYRMFAFIENTYAIQKTENPRDCHAAGAAFGRFQHMLADFPVTSLFEVIPYFHNTQKRLDQLDDAVSADVCGRVSEVAEELAAVEALRPIATLITSRLRSGELPLRVTHNDTKIDNILFDRDSEQPRAVIDLDTIMIGSALYDYGDSIRSGCNPTTEDETNLSKVECNLEFYEAYTNGFLTGCDGTLTEEELSLLPESAQLLAFECGVRFLTDYLAGDVYFKTTYEGQNLNRCRTQLKLAQDIGSKLPQMHEIVDRLRV